MKEREPHSYNVYRNYILLLLIVVNLSLSLICNLNFVIGMYVWKKNIVYIGFGTIHCFRHLVGVLKHIPKGEGGISVLNLIIKVEK